MRQAIVVATLALVSALPASAKKLTIVHTNDIHSHIASHGPGFRYGGYDRLATLVNEIRATTPNVLLLDGGDWIEGSLYIRLNADRAVAPFEWAGTADLHMFQLLGYDAIVLGNHDYIDYNHTINNGNPVPDTVIQRLDRAGNTYPILSYNFRSQAVPAIDAYLVDQGDSQGFVLLDVNGVSVAIAGVSEELFVYQLYLADESALDDPGGAFTQPVIDAMNALSPDVTMLLNHVGHGEDQGIVSATSGLDLIVGGHSHTRLFSVDTVMDASVPPRPVSIVQAGEYGMYLGRLDLDIDDATGEVTVDSYGLIPVDQNVPSEPTVKAEVDTFTTAVLTKHPNAFGDSIGTTNVDVVHASRESQLGNLVTDAMLAVTAGPPYNASMALISDGAVSNPGGTLINGLRPGNVTTDDVHRLYGFGYNPQVDKNFRIFTLSYTGAQIRWIQETFNFGDLIASLGEGLFLSMSGAEIVYDPTLPDGSRITSFLVGGVPLVDNQGYTLAVGEAELAVIDYAESVGFIPFSYQSLQTTDIEVWQALKDHIAASSPLDQTEADIDGRYRSAQQDLGVENYDIAVAPASFRIGDTATISVTVENFGETASAGGEMLELYTDTTSFEWVDDPAYDASSLIGSVAIPPVPAFPGTQTVQVSWDTTGLRPGPLPIYARLVGLSEANDANHFAFTTATGLVIPWRLATGPGAGPANAPNLRTWRGLGTPTRECDLAAYGATGYGVNVAAGDVDGVATDEEVLTGPGPGAVYGPQVRAFRLDCQPLAKVSFFAYGTLKYGVNVAGAGIDQDGYSEILTGAGPGEVFGPHVRGFNYDGTALTAISKVNLFAYSTLKYGVNVARGDVDADQIHEILTAPGPGLIFGSQVRGFNYDGAGVSAINKINFVAFTSSYGARVEGANLDGDPFAELVVAPGPGPANPSQVRGFNYDGVIIAPMAGVDFFPYTTLYGARVAAGDVDADTIEEILASAGPDPAAQARVRGFNVDSATALPPGELDFLVYDGSTYGANAAVVDLAP